MNRMRTTLFGLVLSPILIWAQTSISPTPPISRPAFTGAPFSGQRVSQSRHTLADASTLTINAGTQFLFRDSQGRTRSEFTTGSAPEEAAKVVEINDPVAGYRYFLDARDRVARRQKFVALASRPPGSAPIRVAPPSTVRPENKFERLGSQTMEGVTVEGTRTTTTFPVGFMGNDREFTTTMESWQCRELGETILTKSFDPRRGENSSRLTNIIRGEPDASLFQPPPDYKIVDQ
jgi:hypothetical protein